MAERRVPHRAKLHGQLHGVPVAPSCHRQMDNQRQRGKSANVVVQQLISCSIDALITDPASDYGSCVVFSNVALVTVTQSPGYDAE